MTGNRRQKIHQTIYAGGLALLAIGLPSSVFLMSISQIILFLNWLVEGGYDKKFRRLFSNRAALVFISIYLVHIIALLYSSNFDYGVSTLRTRLPIFLLTLVVVSSDPVPRGYKKWLIMAFAGSVTIVSFFSLHTYVTGNYADYRELSPFISHIRLSLMVALSVFLMAYAAKYYFKDDVGWSRTAWLLAGWHVVYLLMLHSLSGILVFGAACLVLFLQGLAFAEPKKRMWAVTALVAIALAFSFMVGFLWHNVTMREEVNAENLESHTEQGNPYEHRPELIFSENGHLVYLYVAEKEIRKAWNQVSRHDFDGLNQRGEPVKQTLLRYMTSMGLRKDAEGFSELTQDDIRAVEEGIANVQYTRWPWPLVRLHQSFWEINNYRITQNAQGHTLSQRIEFWRAAVEAISKKPLHGWGTGDIREASQYGLEKINSTLEFERWMKPHNQYLSFTVLFGIPGMLWILFAMVYPAKRLDKFRHVPFLAFFVILWVSMLNEDTIDTQAGLSFFVFFYNYFLFLRESPAD